MPSPKSTEYVFSYDVSDNHERRRVEKILLGYGFRRQYSVFVCRLTRSNKEHLLRQLEALSLKTGFVMVVRIAPATHTQIIGTCTRPDPDTDYAFII